LLRSGRGRAAAVAVVAVIAAIVAGVVLITSSSVEPPATGAARVVPGNALAYIHVSTDRARPPVHSALSVASRFPTFPALSAIVDTRLAQIAGGGADVSYESDIRPWLGKEAAIAFLGTRSSTAGSEIVLSVSNRRAAQRFLSRVGAAPAGSYRSVALHRLHSGTELAFVHHYLVVGQAATVAAAIDTAAGRRPSLAATSAYLRAASGEPAGRVIDAYFSGAGITRLLAAQGGVIGALGAVLYQPGTVGTAISISPTQAGASVRVHTALDARSVASTTSRTFTPSLAQVLPSGSLMLLDLMNLPRSAPRVLGTSAAAGVGGRLGTLLHRLGIALAAEGVDVGAIDKLFEGETAVALGSTSSGTPALVVVTRTSQQRRVREQLGNLEVPLANLFPAPSQGSGRVPQFNARKIDGVTVHQVSLAPGLNLAYAVFRGLIVVSTSVDAIGAVAHHSRSVAQELGYEQTLSDQPRPVTSLVFLDFSQLVRLTERTGLTSSASFRTLRSDLETISAVGLETMRGRAGSTAEITLQIK
jgi:hypothetical protein